jgi:tryptophan synthase beta chain
MAQIKFFLDENKLPRYWYNIQADLPQPLPPPLHPGTKQPLGPQDLARLFPMALIGQEVSQDREIEIPEEVWDFYRLWRPSPLMRAQRLEKALDTPAHIYFKYEGVSPVGSHKLNTAIAQAYFNHQEGVKRLATETGAGQWGTALALAGKVFGIEVKVFMVRVSYDQKPYRRAVMETYGAQVSASPSTETESGRRVLAENPDTTGSLGIAISEAIETALKDEGTKYSLGSVLNHVMLHQTVIGLESIAQMELAGEYPDVVIGCAGGGSNLAGISFPFIGANFREKKKTKILAIEPASCPTLTKGVYTYDFGDESGFTPYLKMHTLGHRFVPPGLHAGGLRYHGMSPLVSHLVNLGQIEPRACNQIPCFEAATQFAQTEGIIPAPESSHAIRAAIDEALRCRQEGRREVILFNLSGHGHFDMSAFTKYLGGEMVNYEYDPSEAMKDMPQI